MGTHLSHHPIKVKVMSTFFIWSTEDKSHFKNLISLSQHTYIKCDFLQGYGDITYSVTVVTSVPWDTERVLRLDKDAYGKSLFSPELKSYSITQWNCTTIGPARSRQNGRGIWLYKRLFRHRILRLLRLKRRLSRAATWHGKVRSTRSVSQGTEVTTVTEYVPCRYSTRTASW